MKIPAINSVNNNSFKGLWGKSSQNREQWYSEQYDICKDTTTKEYYPFKDEPQCTIDEVVKRNTTSKHEMVDYSRKSVLEYTDTAVKVMPSLDFTAFEWARYIGNSLKSSLKINKIENNLRNLHLEKHIRP